LIFNEKLKIYLSKTFNLRKIKTKIYFFFQRMMERRKFIKDYLSNFIPFVISNLIGDYDYEFAGKCEFTLEGHTYWIYTCNILSNGKDFRLITSSFDSTLKIWNLQKRNCDITLRNNEYCYACLPNDSSGPCCSGSCFAWQAERDNRIVTALYSKLYVQKIHKKHNGDFDIKFEGHIDFISCCSIISNTRLVSGSFDRTLKVWDLLTKKCELTLVGHTGWIKCCAVLPDRNGFRLVSGSLDKTLKIWNLQTGKCELTLEGHSDIIECCAVLSEGHLVSGSADKTLKVWNVNTGKCELTLEGHSDIVQCCAILPDGRIISGSDDGTLKIWNLFGSAEQPTGPLASPRQVKTGKCELTLKGHARGIKCCVVLPDGLIVSGSSDNTIRIWN
jgi:WD40 repeat protein